MNIALVGYGKMGKAIERIALSRGHVIVSIIDVENTDDFFSETFRSADVAIEFTTPQTAFDNYMRCFAAGVPVVSGTTGWLERFAEVKQVCLAGKHTFFYASNFSIGVNIFFVLNAYLAKIMNKFPAYDVNLTEIHHIHKADAPSGTAITLAGEIVRNVERKTQWQLADAPTVQPSHLLIQSIREGETPGTHRIIYESNVDSISIRHEAKSREGFAQGAVIAAEFTAGKQGCLGMEDMLTF
ncbi:MAG: 4-hydroxy-tetrahydrodipicolinate reductase [Tannerellaceae bacterium]|jgi:4-hydroxy-tetrahydrodipicolinate reductase|nr:4-hydroxy-tetrahydrodipicolinate reductase [Tannerellaceae bacterium]